MFVEGGETGLLGRSRMLPPEKGIRSYRAIALTSVMSEWYASCVLLRLEKENEPDKLRSLHMGGVDGISCKRLQVLVTNLLQKHWEWQEECGDETWYSGKTDDVFGKLGHQDGLR